MDTKSLSSRQVRWAQELSCYYFQINYCQEKANGAADALSRFFQQDNEEKVNLQTENTRILHRLQSSLTNASLSGLSVLASLSPLHQVFLCGSSSTTAQPILEQFPYQTSRRGSLLS